MGLNDWANKRRGMAPSPMDAVRGFGRAIRNEGLNGGMSPLRQRAYAKQVKAERLASGNLSDKERRLLGITDSFGNGEVPEKSNFTGPVHATTRDGRQITIAYRKGNQREYLVADGHVGYDSFYAKAKHKSHDHFVDGAIVADRNAST